MAATLLVELLTEELPPKSLARLGEAFGRGIVGGLVQSHLAAQDVAGTRWFATPRRLAVLVPGVLQSAADRASAVDGPSIKAPRQALEGFARKHGVAVEALEQRETPKGPIVVANTRVQGAALDAVLSGIVADAVKKLPVAKLMRWGSGDAQFVRPVHGLVMLHGDRLVPGTVLGASARASTRGHRFLGARSVALASAEAYEARLRDDGWVIADFSARRAEIERQLLAGASRLGGVLGEYRDLLEEVTALVEHPTVYAGAFDPGFLEVPQECLILTMRQNQKYFPLFDAAGRLLPKFLIVSNMQLEDPRHVIEGNERVVRPRLEDARFFYNQDRRRRLEDRVPQLAKVVYHNQLGSQLERVERMQLLAGRIARDLGGDPALAERAAWLAKADLVTGMVGEFPELQGVMGAYYARHDLEDPAVVAALRDQYRPRLEAGAEPVSLVSAALYLADRIDALVGLFAVGSAPTGEKDPFGLRRAALGIIDVYQMLTAADRPRPQAVPGLRDLLAASADTFPPVRVKPAVVDEVLDFVLERYRHGLTPAHARDAVDAVLALRPHLGEVVARVRAVEAFRTLPEAESLAAANKRIRNILLKSPPPSAHTFSETLFHAEAERELHAAFRRSDAAARAHLAAERFAEALAALAELKRPVDAFFDGVMVNVEDVALRNNRLALLQLLDGALNRVADLSRLAA